MHLFQTDKRFARNEARVQSHDGRILFLEHGVSNLEDGFVKLQECREKKHYETLGCSLLEIRKASC